MFISFTSPTGITRGTCNLSSEALFVCVFNGGDNLLKDSPMHSCWKMKIQVQMLWCFGVVFALFVKLLRPRLCVFACVIVLMWKESCEIAVSMVAIVRPVVVLWRWGSFCALVLQFQHQLWAEVFFFLNQQCRHLLCFYVLSIPRLCFLNDLPFCCLLLTVQYVRAFMFARQDYCRICFVYLMLYWLTGRVDHTNVEHFLYCQLCVII